MKRILALSLVAALLGGCAIVPLGHRDDGWRHRQSRDDGYRSYNYDRRDDWRGYRDDWRGYRDDGRGR